MTSQLRHFHVIIAHQELQICEWWFNVDCSRSEEFYPLPPESSLPPAETEPEKPIFEPVVEVPKDILEEDDFSPLARSESRVEGQREGRRRKLSRGRSASRRGQGRTGRQFGGRQGGGRRESRERTSGRRGRQGFPSRRLESLRIEDEEARHYDGYADYSQPDPVYAIDDFSHLEPVYASDDFSHIDPVYAGDSFSDFTYPDYQPVPYHSQGDISDYYYY